MKSRNNISAKKRDYRNRLKALRNNLTESQTTHFNQTLLENLNNLAELQTAQRIFSYISNGSEVDTHALIRSRIDHLAVLAVPKITHNTTMIAVKFSSWEELQPGPMGILTPVSNEICPDPYDVVITPGLGFTRDGIRMGYGRGYYDRWFSNNRVKTKIALCYSVQIVDELPHDDYDIPVDIIVTENEVIHIRQN